VDQDPCSPHAAPAWDGYLERSSSKAGELQHVSSCTMRRCCRPTAREASRQQSLTLGIWGAANPINAGMKRRPSTGRQPSLDQAAISAETDGVGPTEYAVLAGSERGYALVDRFLRRKYTPCAQHRRQN